MSLIYYRQAVRLQNITTTKTKPCECSPLVTTWVFQRWHVGTTTFGVYAELVHLCMGTRQVVKINNDNARLEGKWQKLYSFYCPLYPYWWIPGCNDALDCRYYLHSWLHAFLRVWLFSPLMTSYKSKRDFMPIFCQRCQRAPYLPPSLSSPSRTGGSTHGTG